MDSKAHVEYNKAGHHIVVNNQKYDWHNDEISDSEIRTLANIPDSEEIFYNTGKTEFIISDMPTIIDLRSEERESFYSKTIL